MSNEGLIPDRWEPKKETYTPTVEEVEEVHNGLTKDLFPEIETLNKYPGLEYSLKYERGNNWPLIVIGEQNNSGKRLVWMTLRSSISSSKALEYYLDQDGKVSLTENPATDSLNKQEFTNRIEGFKSSIENAKKKGVLSNNRVQGE